MFPAAASPKLPTELKREVFEVAASLHPSSIPVAQSSSSSPSGSELKSDRTSAVPRCYPQRPAATPIPMLEAGGILAPIATLIVSADLSPESANLEASPDLERLALPLQRFSVHLDRLPYLPFTTPLFAQIAHLNLVEWHANYWAEDGWSGLALLPRLSHLSYDDTLPDRICKGALAYCRLLMVLALVWSREDLYGFRSIREPFLSDPRFVVVGIIDYSKDWENGARGGADYWVVAAAHVERRRAGETNGILGIHRR
ncbi:hypothetical protein DFH07DRAFT_1060284 [Mycena maculata]|uniref:Uncharacterized protein n=1 Tax=Mycena maculata TaxID=230809 RepID=A0AAD7NEP3_9AGAR|nr:hypothetical protein DFH07DRAFT_1060284 [Mycena maculata]